MSAEVVSIVDVLTNLTTEKVNLSKLHVVEPTWFVSSVMLIGVINNEGKKWETIRLSLLCGQY